MHTIWKVEKVLLKQNNKIRAYTTGTLCLTPAYIIFIEPTGVKETWVCFVTMATILLSWLLQVLYHHVSSVERLPLTTKGYPLIIKCHTFLILHLVFPRESECVNVIDTIKILSHPGTVICLIVYYVYSVNCCNSKWPLLYKNCNFKLTVKSMDFMSLKYLFSHT